jgi:hypothetical protein
VKAVTDTLGVARSNLVERLAGARKTRGPQEREGDDAPGAEIRVLDAALVLRQTACLLKSRGYSTMLTKVLNRWLVLAAHTSRQREREASCT